MNVQSATINGVRVNLRDRVRVESFGRETLLKPGIYQITYLVKSHSVGVYVSMRESSRPGKTGRAGFGHWVEPGFKIRHLRGSKK